MKYLKQAYMRNCCLPDKNERNKISFFLSKQQTCSPSIISQMSSNNNEIF